MCSQSMENVILSDTSDNFTDMFKSTEISRIALPKDSVNDQSLTNSNVDHFIDDEVLYLKSIVRVSVKDSDSNINGSFGVSESASCKTNDKDDDKLDDKDLVEILSDNQETQSNLEIVCSEGVEFEAKILSFNEEEVQKIKYIETVSSDEELNLISNGTDSLGSDLESESRRVNETSPEIIDLEDTLILSCSESDLDLEMERCEEVLNSEKYSAVNNRTDENSPKKALEKNMTTLEIINNMNSEENNDVEHQKSKVNINKKEDLLEIIEDDTETEINSNHYVSKQDEENKRYENSNSIKVNHFSSKTDASDIFFFTADVIPQLNEISYKVINPSSIKTTPEKSNPKRIFELAIGSISNKNSNIETISGSAEQTEIINQEQDFKKIKNEVVKDYLEDEKDDIINPEWEVIKNLSTNEERYQQVRSCWKSRTVPDPNKNLTYHSFRKKWFTTEVRPIRQHKRQASSSLHGRNAKRPCTFFLDKKIGSIIKTKDEEKQEIISEMQCKITQIDKQCFEMERHLLYRGFNYYDRSNMLQNEFNNKVFVISDEYNKMTNSCEAKYRSQIGTLNQRRDEVLQFNSFYKGLNDSKEDLNFLSETQFKELEEIEHIYTQFDHYYG